MAKEWINMGNKVCIVGASFSHVRTVQPETLKEITEETIDGIKYIWVRTPVYKGNGVGRFLNMLTFIVKLILFNNKILKMFSPDVVIASSTYPLDIFPAKILKKKVKAKLIYEVHDLWPLSPMILGGMSKYHPFIMLMQIGENMACKWADKVVSMLPLAKEHLQSHGMAPQNFVYVPNGIVLEDWETDEKVPEIHKKEIEKLKTERKFLVCYAGSHGLANALEPFIKCGKYVEELGVYLVLIGDGPCKSELIDMAKKEGITNVSFLPPVPKRNIPAILREMDLLFFSLQKCPLFRFGVSPNKLFDYMMAEKPIINAVEAGNDLVRESGCGITVEPGNIENYVNAIKLFVKMKQEEREAMGKRGKEFVLKHHNYKILAHKFFNEMKG